MSYITKVPTFNGWKWFSIALILIAIFLLYKTCNPTPNPVLPSVIPTTVQKESVKVDSIASQKYKDSVLRVISEKEKAADVWYNEWKASEVRYSELEKGFTDLALKEIPDTCKGIRDAFVLQINKLSAEKKMNALNCEKTISGFRGMLKQKDALIKNGKDDYAKLKLRFDTSLAQQDRYGKIIKQVKSKTEIYAGIMAMGTQIKPFEGVGVSLGLRNKKGSQFEVFALQFNSGLHYGVSLKKTLIKF